ncbi:MAG TPA: hypothetical protein VM261_00455 [Kofleriaceae bacterium]|nr:hypothetical protein [Kofleriaceae bacterium]
MRLRSVLVLALACTTALSVTVNVVRAQPTADDPAAEALFDEAVVLRNAGDRAGACTRFRRSYKLSPARGTLLNIAECFEADGRLASAWAAYSALADASETAGDRERMLIARAKRAELERRLAYLTIAVMAARPGLVVRRDDTTLSNDALGDPVPVDAGLHRVTVTALGFQSWSTEVDVTDGARRRVDVPALEPLPPPEPDRTLGAVARPPAPPRHERATAGRLLVLSGAASGAVGLGFGVAAWRTDWMAHARCSDDDVCDVRGYQQQQDARALARRANLFVGVGATLAIAGGVLWWTAPVGKELRVAPVAGPGALGLVVGGQL